MTGVGSTSSTLSGTIYQPGKNLIRYTKIVRRSDRSLFKAETSLEKKHLQARTSNREPVTKAIKYDKTRGSSKVKTQGVPKKHEPQMKFSSCL